MFINLSNHPSTSWLPEQREAAEHYGEIIDLPFPQVPPKAKSRELDEIVSEYYNKVWALLARNTPDTNSDQSSSDLSSQRLSDAAEGAPHIIESSEVSTWGDRASGPAAVMLQGEMTFTFRLVTRLKADGILCLAACSERKVEECISENGEVKKVVIFEFAGFREY